MRRALLIANPRSGGGNAEADAVADWFRTQDIDLSVCISDSPEQARSALLGAAGRVDCVILLGGDGTLHHALPALLESGLTLGLLPGGTANDFARSLGIPLNLHDACAAIVDGQERRVDIAFAGTTPFVNAVHVGLVAQAASSASADAKRSLGPLAYLGNALARLRHRSGFRVEIDCDGVSHRFESIQVTAGNAPYFGGGNLVHPHATLDDGVMHLYSIRPTHPLRLFLTGLLLRWGRGGAGAGVDRLAGARLSIRTERPMEVTADGEQIGTTPIELRLAHNALAVIVPRRPAAGLLLDDDQAALRDLARALRSAESGCRHAVSLARHDATRELLQRIAERRTGAAVQIERFVRELGAEPAVPDADWQAIEHAVERIRGLLAADADRVLRDDQRRHDDAAVRALEAARRLGLPERMRDTLECLATELEEDRGQLDEAGGG